MTSLRARLILAFAVIIFLTLALVGSGFVYILREFQAQREMDRLAGLAITLTGQFRSLDQSGASREEIVEYIRRESDELDVGIVLINPQGVIVADSENRMIGRRLDFSNASRFGPLRRMRVAAFSGEDEILFVIGSFVPPTNPDRPPRSQHALGLVAPQQTITSAWMALIPRLAVVAAIALLLSTAVAWLLAASIARPLAAMTRASEEMARGNYDQELPIRGRDEIGRLASAFNEMARQVAHSHRTLRDFVANVSHDLRTPLTSIQGFAQALMDGAVRGQEGAAQAGRIIYDEAERMRRLVEDLLELSRIESGQVRLELAPMDLEGLARQAAERFAGQALERGVSFDADINPVPFVLADSRRIDQVLDNLLSNALKFTPPGGAVTIRVRPQRAARGQEVILAVHNTGSYITPDELPRIFERFYQVDKSRANAVTGSGLGLAIAQEIAQAHRGSLIAASHPATGTEFRLALPALAATPSLELAAAGSVPFRSPEPLGDGPPFTSPGQRVERGG